MSLDKKLTAYEIVKRAGMCPQPEYYSGRGALLCDLDSEKLKKIYDLIAGEHGNKAAKNFADMVANIKVLSASDFLTCLNFLEASKWEYKGFQSDLIRGIAVKKDSDGNYDAGSGIAGVISALSFSGRNETEFIRRPFLKEVHYDRDEAKKKMMEINGIIYPYDL